MKDKLKQSKLIKNILPIAILIASPILLFSTLFVKHKESVLRNETIITTQNTDVVQNEKSKYKFVQVNMYTKGVVFHDKTDDLDHLYMWGYNSLGQLGIGNTDFQKTPTEVLFKGKPLGLEGEITGFSSSFYNSGVTIKNKNGETDLYMWGENLTGNVANEDSENKTTVLSPQKIKIIDEDIYNKPLDVINFYVGEYASALILTDSNNKKDHLFVWGKNSAGLIPDQKGDDVFIPTKIASTGDDIGDNGKIKNLTKVTMGLQNQFVVVRDEKDREHLFSWGRNTSASLGNGAPGIDSKTTDKPTKLNLGGGNNGKYGVDGEIIKLSTATTSSAVAILDPSGKTTLWAWGDNSDHKLGHENSGNLHYPHKITEFAEDGLSTPKDIIKGEIIDFNIGEEYSIITISDDGVLTAYKSGNALGDNGATERFTKIKTPENFELISWKMASYNNLLLVKKNGQKSIFEIGKRVVSGTGTIISYNKYEKIQFASEHIKKINSIDPTFVQSSGSSNLVLFYDIDLPEDKIIQRSPKIEEIFLRGSNLPSETKNSEIITDGLPTGKIIVEEVDNKNVLTNLYLVVKYRITNKNKSYSTNLEPIRIIEFSASEQPVQYNLSLHDITYNSVLVTFYIANISIDKKVNIEFYQGDNEIALGSIMIESPDPEKTEDKYVYKIAGLNEKTKYNLKMSINGSTPKNIGAMTTHSMDPISRTKEYIYIASIATLAVVIIVLMILLFVL